MPSVLSAFVFALVFVTGGWLGVAAAEIETGAFSVSLPKPGAGGSLRVEGYVFDDRAHTLRVVDEGSLEHPVFGGIDPAMRRHGAVAGINGGFFGPDGMPLGMMVSDGEVVGRLARGALTSGVVFRGERGLILWRTAEYEAKGSPRAREMLQAGPFLLDAGAVVSGLEATRSRTRTFVLHDMEHGWVVAITGPATLDELARTLGAARGLRGVRPVRALNLDGGSSSALWIQGGTRRKPWKPVRNYLAVVPKNP